jgi:hypothetical protein
VQAGPAHNQQRDTGQVNQYLDRSLRWLLHQPELDDGANVAHHRSASSIVARQPVDGPEQPNSMALRLDTESAVRLRDLHKTAAALSTHPARSPRPYAERHLSRNCPIGTGAFAQSGSVGGVIGKDNKAVSGSVAAPRAVEPQSSKPKAESSSRGYFDGAWLVLGTGTPCGSSREIIVISGGWITGDLGTSGQVVRTALQPVTEPHQI